MGAGQSRGGRAGLRLGEAASSSGTEQRSGHGAAVALELPGLVLGQLSSGCWEQRVHPVNRADRN